MVKCPFCSYANEEGALFCEQCKSDLSAVAAIPAAAPVHHDQHGHGQHGHGQHDAPAHVPVAEVIEAVEIIEAVPVDEAMPAPPHHLTPVSAAAEVAYLAPPHHEAEHIPSAEFVDVPAEIPMPIPDPHPGPLPGMTPPLEPEAIATHEAAAAAAAHAAPPPPAPAPSAPAPAGSKGVSVPAGAQPKLVVKRGQKVGFEFPIYGGDNYVGRSDDKPVDVDLEDQEPPERVWCSRQHALIHYDENAGSITVEDLNSSNGTFVNRERVYPGQPRQLYVNDTVQIGTVHLTLKV